MKKVLFLVTFLVASGIGFARLFGLSFGDIKKGAATQVDLIKSRFSNQAQEVPGINKEKSFSFDMK